MTTSVLSDDQLIHLAQQIKDWGRELGFQQVAISDLDLAPHESHLEQWLADRFHGEMDYMQRHGKKRSQPAQLLPGTLRIISVRMDHLPPESQAVQVLKQPDKAYIARYALGRDYHKTLRKRLTQLGAKIVALAGEHGSRAFVDSAPVLEKAIAEKAGLGWIGKHTLLLNRHAGSWFFLGELFTNLPLPVDPPTSAHCGSCQACIDICPTQAIVAPYRLDARRCISYLTIELKNAIPLEFRRAMGNRVFGCDDCQLVCPWNKFAKVTMEPDFYPRHGLESGDLLTLFQWDEATYLQRTEGSALRRLGYQRWLRNLAVGLGNAPYSAAIEAALRARLDHPSELVREHVHWALQQQLAANQSTANKL